MTLKTPDSRAQLIVGIDPGLRITGWGVVRKIDEDITIVAYGCLKIGTKATLSQRLHQLNQDLDQVLCNHRPDVVAIEKIFVNTNALSSLNLGYARGVALMTVAACGLPVYEYPATTVKKAITGYGHASKTQMVAMIQRLLHIEEMPSPDSADALSIALCHAYGFAQAEEGVPEKNQG